VGWLEFISATIGQLISWPVAIVVAVLLLRKELQQLIPTLHRARLGPGGAEFEFKEDLEEIKQKADQAELPPPAEGRLRYRAAADWRISLTDLAKKDPPGAILVAWGFVEEELAELADRLNLFPIPLPRQRSPLRISRKLSAVGALSDEMFGLIDSLRLLSKSVANAPAPRMLAAEALEYIEVAQRVVEQLRALPTSSGESEK
jgi:hypothetical protein